MLIINIKHGDNALKLNHQNYIAFLSKCCFPNNYAAGFLLLLLIAGADCWPWGSDPWCPPGPEPKCPINPLTDQENYFLHPNDCHYYIQCDGSRRPICRPCSPGTYFSNKFINCVWPQDAACPHNDTTTQGTRQPPICGPDRCIPLEKKTVNGNCTHYYICINGIFQERNCPEGEHFNNKTKKCEDQCKAGCKKCCEIRDCKHNCKKFPHPNICNQYRDECTYTWQECNGTLDFNPKTEKCANRCEEYIEGCPCIKPPPIPPPVNCENCERCKNCYTNLTENCTTIKSCEFRRHQKDCQLYYNDCSQMWSRCPGNLHFSEVTQSCVHPCNAGCKDPKGIRECCTTEGEVFEDPCSCNTYYICRNGIKELVKCEDGLQYNRALGHCDKSCSCECAKLFAGKPECCASTGDKPEPQCPVTTYPIFMPHPTNGQFFYTYLNGVRSCSRCPLQHRGNIDRIPATEHLLPVQTDFYFTKNMMR